MYHVIILFKLQNRQITGEILLLNKWEILMKIKIIYAATFLRDLPLFCHFKRDRMETTNQHLKRVCVVLDVITKNCRYSTRNLSWHVTPPVKNIHSN